MNPVEVAGVEHSASRAAIRPGPSSERPVISIACATEPDLICAPGAGGGAFGKI